MSCRHSSASEHSSCKRRSRARARLQPTVELAEAEWNRRAFRPSIAEIQSGRIAEVQSARRANAHAACYHFSLDASARAARLRSTALRFGNDDAKKLACAIVCVARARGGLRFHLFARKQNVALEKLVHKRAIATRLGAVVASGQRPKRLKRRRGVDGRARAAKLAGPAALAIVRKKPRIMLLASRRSAACGVRAPMSCATTLDAAAG